MYRILLVQHTIGDKAYKHMHMYNRKQVLQTKVFGNLVAKLVAHYL